MLFLAALLISIMAHLGMIWRTVEGNLFIGFGDGISQMLTFKQYIFEKYQQGNWAYSQDFGFGGGIFATLNYYYTTNIFMLLWFLAFVVFSIEPTIETWIHLLIPISIVKQMLLFTAAFYYLKLLIPKKGSPNNSPFSHFSNRTAFCLVASKSFTILVELLFNILGNSILFI